MIVIYFLWKIFDFSIGIDVAFAIEPNASDRSRWHFVYFWIFLLMQDVAINFGTRSILPFGLRSLYTGFITLRDRTVSYFFISTFWRGTKTSKLNRSWERWTRWILQKTNGLPKLYKRIWNVSTCLIQMLQFVVTL